MKPILLGLSGEKGAGKDTVFNLLADYYNLKRLAFADPLKEEVAHACGVTVEFLNAHKENFRLILQGWGTEFRRQLCSKTYWIDKAGVALQQAIAENPTGIVFTDVRFKNESDFIYQHGGEVWRITRERHASTDQHPSETQIGVRYSRTIPNNSSIAAFSEIVRDNFWKLISRHETRSKTVPAAATKITTKPVPVHAN